MPFLTMLLRRKEARRKEGAEEEDDDDDKGCSCINMSGRGRGTLLLFFNHFLSV